MTEEYGRGLTEVDVLPVASGSETQAAPLRQSGVPAGTARFPYVNSSLTWGTNALTALLVQD
ncbi:MAG: hypothetical protein HOY79_27860 [Streptomyces sp.]|nr:hypothetical protein [Streptomyces sp.]